MVEEDSVPVSGVVAGSGVTLSTEKENIRGCGSDRVFSKTAMSSSPLPDVTLTAPPSTSEVYVPSS